MRSSLCRPAAAHRFSGSTFLVVLVLVVVLAALLTGAISRISSNQVTGYHAASWHEALDAADAGVDLAMRALNTGDWTGWVDAGGTKSYEPPPVVHAGEGNRTLRTSIVVDAPGTLVYEGRQWYRIRSIGIADIPGPRRLAYDTLDVRLRKVSLLKDRVTGASLTSPQVSRWVEAIARANRDGWKRALTLQQSISTESSVIVDSFDSRDATKSTSGLYDLSKRQYHGAIASRDSSGSDLRSALVYGDLTWTNAEPLNDSNVLGTISSPFVETIKSVPVPTWSTYNATPASVTSTKTLAGGSKASPARYRLSQINLTAGNSLTWISHTPGQESYVEVWVTGSIDAIGTATIVQEPGVHVTYFVQGNVTATVDAFQNQSQRAGHLVIYGVDPTSGSNTVTFTGDGEFLGVIEAPKFDVSITGAARISGAIVAQSCTLAGGAALHYDEMLVDGADGSGKFSVVSWLECY